MFVELLIFVLTSLIGYYLYVYKKIHYHYEKHGIKYLPGLPFFGNMMKSICLKAHMWEDFDEVYRAFPEEKYVGFIEGTNPTILIREPETIKRVTIKDFDYFVNHKKLFPDDVGTMLGDSVLMMKDDRWRDMRATLSPAFTGSKIKFMIPFMVDISKNIVEYLKDHKSEDIDVYDLMHRYSSDIIASVAFGLEVNSLKDKNNVFFKSGHIFSELSFSQRIYLMIHVLCPTFAKKIGVQIIPAKTENIFRDLVANTMDYRFKNNVVRYDMIQLLMEASKGTLKYENDDEKHKDLGIPDIGSRPKNSGRKWNDNELAAQLFIFFLAGFETTANSLTMCIHELAVNPDIQEKLYQELRTYKESKGSFQFDSISELKYMDCVMNEISRKWSAALVLNRICSKTYELPPLHEGGKPYRVEPGDLVYSAVNSIHQDPKYYPNPEKFDPQRFSDENKYNIKNETFLSFGAGPRSCIGARFAMLEFKVLIYHLVLNFKIVKCGRTTDPIRLLPADFHIRALGGTWVRFEPRE